MLIDITLKLAPKKKPKPSVNFILTFVPNSYFDEEVSLVGILTRQRNCPRARVHLKGGGLVGQVWGVMFIQLKYIQG